MERFTRLFVELDRTNRTSEKVAAMEAYFREAPARDAAWGLYFLSGERLTRVLKSGVMGRAAEAQTGLPGWLMDDCREATGDSSEAYALLLGDGDGAGGGAPSLHEVMEQWIKPLVYEDQAKAEARLREAWGRLHGREQRYVFNKLVRGALRVGVSRGLVVRALSRVAGVDTDVMAHRLSGKWTPSEAAYARLVSGQTGEDDHLRPYPFCLANQLNGGPEALGAIGEWMVEYKWDGIRAQVLRRAIGGAGGSVRTMIWSRGEEVVTEQFPEVAAGAASLPAGTVLDGEILAWRHDGTHGGDGSALGFNALQTRLNRKNVQPSLFDTEGVVFVAFDVLEHQGRDVREWPMRERREVLERVYREHVQGGGSMKLSRVLDPATWEEAARLRAGARTSHNAEGLVLKHRSSAYHVGRAVIGVERDEDGPEAGADEAASGAGDVGGWWKWKIEPFAVDAVLMAAQPGSGKRAGLYTDYTFGVWDGDALTPIAKAYSGLDADEIARVDAFVRKNTMGRAGPVRMVRPELVFEIGFEGIRASTRHRSGVAVRFPRILRWRTDKPAAEANTIAFVRELLAKFGG